MLHDAIVLLRRLYEEAAFLEDMAGGFLDVKVLAGCESRKRHGDVPVMRRREDESVDGFVIEQVAEVGD